MSNRKPYLTYIFLGLQCLVFRAMTFLGGSENSYLLLLFGAKENSLIALHQEYWRLFTPIFIHIGFVHLLMNSLVLYYLGSFVEKIIGSWRFALLYILSGVMGNLLSYQFSWGLSAGASTSLFGLFAFFVTMAYLKPDNPYYSALGQQYKTLIILNIILNLFSTNIDLAGHLGGALGGVLMTLWLMSDEKEERPYRWLAAGLYLGVTIFILLNHGHYNSIFA